MRVFIERFVLAILASLVVLLAAINPLGFCWPLKIVSIIVIVIVAGIAAHFAGWDEWRWERLREVWWLWSLVGLSGGIALALWLSPFLVNLLPKDLSAMQSQISTKDLELGNMRQQLTALQSELSSKQVELNHSKQEIDQSIGPVVAIKLASRLGLSTETKTIPQTFVVVAAGGNNEGLRRELEDLIILLVGSRRFPVL